MSPEPASSPRTLCPFCLRAPAEVTHICSGLGVPSTTANPVLMALAPGLWQGALHIWPWWVHA